MQNSPNSPPKVVDAPTVCAEWGDPSLAISLSLSPTYPSCKQSPASEAREASARRTSASSSSSLLQAYILYIGVPAHTLLFRLYAQIINRWLRARASLTILERTSAARPISRYKLVYSACVVSTTYAMRKAGHVAVLRLLVLASVFLCGTSVHGLDEEQCYSYAGGTVYPHGSKHEGHQLHTTKAVSEYFRSISRSRARYYNALWNFFRFERWLTFLRSGQRVVGFSELFVLYVISEFVLFSLGI